MYAALDKTWSIHTWYIYAACNLLFAFFIYVYQTTYRQTLLFATILMFILLGVIVFLSYHSYSNTPHLIILNNLLSAEEGWALVWSLYTFSQLLVYKFDVSRKTQNILFFILLAVIVGLRIWKSPYAFDNLIGYFVVIVALVMLMFMSQKDSFFT